MSLICKQRTEHTLAVGPGTNQESVTHRTIPRSFAFAVRELFMFVSNAMKRERERCCAEWRYLQLRSSNTEYRRCIVHELK